MDTNSAIGVTDSRSESETDGSSESSGQPRLQVSTAHPVDPARKPSRLTVLIPAWNEAACIADTIRSLQEQTLPPEEIIVCDDCSTDGTGDVARACGVTVVRLSKNSGAKAGAENYVLPQVKTEFIMAIDADTTLERNAVEVLMAAFDKPEVSAACGFVMPRFVKTIWERGRFVEYLWAFGFYKQIQDYYDKPLIASGCFSAYRTKILQQIGGWSTRTVAEDMDLTWTLYEAGHIVRFVPNAISYPIEPHNFSFMRKQLKRWSHGFMQTVKVHWRRLLHVPYLRTMVAVAMWDAVFASLVYLLLLPILAIVTQQPWVLLGYIVDLPAVALPVMLTAMQKKQVKKALASLPGFFVLRTVNAIFVLEAVWSELIVKRQLKAFEKGH